MSIPKFKNEPLTDFTKPSSRMAMEAALVNVRAKFTREYPIIIGGEEVLTPEKITSYNPSNPSEVVGTFQKADVPLALKALEAAESAFQTWQFVDHKKRADYLFRAAKLLRKRKFEFSAVLAYEVGKTWPEADADTAEAIDFLEFYGREMLRLGGPQPVVKVKGEKGELRYIPLGVGVIVPPWNFALAILTGMTSAAVVAGNAVVLKPSSDSPLNGWMFFDLMRQVGLPKGVINYVTGPGGSVGDALVAHPRTRFVSFTGSKEVGVHINELAAKVQPGQKWLKRVVAEMGGKDAIVVDDQADLEGAAQATVASAFGFQGQKCSAASRAIVVEKVYDKFVDLVRKKTEALKVGPAYDPSNYLGPVVNKGSQEKILSYIQRGVQEGGKLVTGGAKATGDGYFIRPTVIADVSPKATIAQEEIFGPVLAVIKANDFDQALEIANDTEFGLTGGVWTKNRKRMEKAKQTFHVGNFYINRKITGAFVGVHPFGGFNMSGTDSKAGGHDYLLLFLQAKSIAEKTG
ncbi:MAG: L-glutamate gamma-semialdehyde dehydrogenase [Ignavibacteria bacterium GWA2_55_11]|nr:MAG: L-glutamate gamma-semialdehyde dehydrogenase [Ignavibacteria bacterium GWA2_55_11]OGU63213.1 MAG: L-glutamate gamma-semialdehyde dehydrogenase [Ignavibacteria bacterium RIFCSPHIGHO2_02_FULL_56_12]OGU71725.1 MAG: L-glutamate gamma-semialdehyde dehydrogenase [Ignavibacteria bacterium RIFCSPLOWO2_02_FULL_55_14]OGU72828.1 MAG: L-glutamate gamma-semialdehyde dehydrogenase [Ignavibacteria bacterium RIFCSPLOWO2_12_FULL_56_21]